MASKCLIFCIFSGILIHNLQSQSVDNGAKSDSATNLDSLDLQSSGVTNRRNNASVSWRRRDVAHPSKDKENRRLLLKAYAEFEAEMNSKITSIIKNLHQAGDCEHGTNNGDGTCRKRPKIDTQILQEDNLIVDDSLLKDRIENIHDILMALISRKSLVFSLCPGARSHSKFSLFFVCSCNFLVGNQHKLSPDSLSDCET